MARSSTSLRLPEFKAVRGVAYSASKGGVRMVTKDLVVEWGEFNIRVNSIMPGAIATPMIASLLHESGSAERY